MSRLVAAVVALACATAAAQTPARQPVTGFTAATSVARVYDTILDGDFAAIPAQLTSTCGPAPAEVCLMLEALALSWQIALEPGNRSLDARFTQAVERGITAIEAWTRREPQRAEAWFYLGAVYGARVQYRVLRKERLAAARDGKRIKEALEQALALDPALHDAKFGIGMYRYYADAAPAALRMLRFLLLLPGGNRQEGLQQMLEARAHGQLVRGEADYQLHLIYLWYERRHQDALALIKDLQTRYPRNPLFSYIEADIHHRYLRNSAAAVTVLRRLIARAQAQQVNSPTVAITRAQALLNAIDSRAH